MPDRTQARITPTYSVVIPTYNNDGALLQLARRIDSVFTKVIREDYEIILVDDGSSNHATWEICEEIVAAYNAKAYQLARNYGKPSAVICGLSHAAGEWVITIDDDLQQAPEDIPALIHFKSHDVVIGTFGTKKHGALVRLSSRVKAFFDRQVLGTPVAMSPLKLIKREVVQVILQSVTPRPFIPAMLSQVTNDFKSVPVTHQRSEVHKSRYTFFSRLSQFSNLTIGNSSILLRMIGLLGGATAALGFLFAAYTGLRALNGSTVVPGWASLIIINLTFGGLILIALGINGEYLIRILESSSDRPPYHVRREKK